MKTTSQLLPFCFFLLTFIYANYFFPVLGGKPKPVFDTDGDELQYGFQYYIESPSPGNGSLTLATTDDDPCQLIVVQQPIFRTKIPPRLPAIFYPENIDETVVRLSTPLNIQFIYTSPCLHENATWQLNRSSVVGEDYVITGNGKIGNPGCETKFNWFKIEMEATNIPGKYYYKFVYNPQVCFNSLDSDIISVFDGQYYRLYANIENVNDADPFMLTFVKVEEPRSRSYFQ